MWRRAWTVDPRQPQDSHINLLPSHLGRRTPTPLSHRRRGGGRPNPSPVHPLQARRPSASDAAGVLRRRRWRRRGQSSWLAAHPPRATCASVSHSARLGADCAHALPPPSPATTSPPALEGIFSRPATTGRQSTADARVRRVTRPPTLHPPPPTSQLRLVIGWAVFETPSRTICPAFEHPLVCGRMTDHTAGSMVRVILSLSMLGKS